MLLLYIRGQSFSHLAVYHNFKYAYAKENVALLWKPRKILCVALREEHLLRELKRRNYGRNISIWRKKIMNTIRYLRSLYFLLRQ